MIVINNAKAVNIAKAKIRIWREAEFKTNDVALQNALVDGTDTSLLVTRREYLRNLPLQCENKSVDELLDILNKLNITKEEQ